MTKEQIEKLIAKETAMEVTAMVRCPVCGTYAQRVHGDYPNINYEFATRCINESCNQKLKRRCKER